MRSCLAQCSFRGCGEVMLSKTSTGYVYRDALLLVSTTAVAPGWATVVLHGSTEEVVLVCPKHAVECTEAGYLVTVSR